MKSIMENVLKRNFGNETDSQWDRFKLQNNSGTIQQNIDYFKQAEEEFGFSVKKARIVVFGCGGAGQNSVTRLTEMGIQGANTVP